MTMAPKEPTVGFLTTMTTSVHEGTSEAGVGSTQERERAQAYELGDQSHLLGLWQPPVGAGERRALGPWSAGDEQQLLEVPATMPSHPWMTVEVTPLAPHPKDPGSIEAQRHR
jgi:muconolactone D-isomerase